MKTVDDIWAEWDKDGSDTLDRTEMRGFVQATLDRMGLNKTIGDDEFNAIFEQFDKDGSGVIERDEMAIFVKKMAGY